MKGNKLTIEEIIQIVKHHLDDLYEKYQDTEDVDEEWEEDVLTYLNETVSDLEEFTYELDTEEDGEEEEE